MEHFYLKFNYKGWVNTHPLFIGGVNEEFIYSKELTKRNY